MNNSTDTKLRQALLHLAADISTQHAPPPASVIWLRAERRARQLAIERATRPLRVMYILGTVVSIVAAAFALHQSTASRSAHGIAAPPTWVLLATVVILAGCAAMFLASRTSARITPASDRSSS